MPRDIIELVPNFSAEIEEIRDNGLTTELLYKIIQKHSPNARYNRDLYLRYMGLSGYVPIHNRQQRFEEEESPINNKISNNFFSEIVNVKVGYFAGSPISYSYSDTKESEDATGNTIDEANKVVTDFTTRNSMYSVDIETTKNASIYGYSGRLFYIDKEGLERVTPVHGFETIILSDTDITEPEYAIRYYKTQTIDGTEEWTVKFYDNKNVTTYKGTLLSLELVETKAHLFDYCPLQGVPNNNECMGDAESVLSLIDDYDKTLSDNSNEIEAFVHAMMQVSVPIDDDELRKAQKSGTIVVRQVGSNPVAEPVKWVTKNINDGFTEHHLDRLEDNIYRFAQCPNLNDESFGTASGVSLRHKLQGLEDKCGAFQSQMMKATQYMWKVLCSSWNKQDIKLDPLQIITEFTRNFPLDDESEARTIQAYISAGFPKRWAFSQCSKVDDVDYIMDMLKKEQEDVAEMYPDLMQAGKNDSTDDTDQEEQEEADNENQ